MRLNGAELLTAFVFAEQARDQCKAALIVLCGLPGAGKTTLSQALVGLINRRKQFCGSLVNDFDNCVHVEFDTVGGESFASNRILSFKCVEEALRRGGIVIADDNQFYKSMRKEYLHLAATLKASYTLVYVKVPLRVALDRNQERKGSKRLPDDVIVRMASIFDTPKGDFIQLDNRPVNINARLVLEVVQHANASSSEHSKVTIDIEDTSNLDMRIVTDLERKSQIRKAILAAKAQGITGHALNRIALGLNETLT